MIAIAVLAVAGRPLTCASAAGVVAEIAPYGRSAIVSVRTRLAVARDEDLFQLSAHGHLSPGFRKAGEREHPQVIRPLRLGRLSCRGCHCAESSRR